MIGALPPGFQHDCPDCISLGRYVHEGHNFDLYYHAEQVIGGMTIVARYSDDGPDYLSGLVFGRNGSSRPLAEAYRRADARGYDVGGSD